ncbi:MAG: HipA N-terminal domain-containing protein [Chitinophagales bacterium]|nr:HipA N-terminal domain-containing protein [Chitinophagales bacterium]
MRKAIVMMHNQIAGHLVENEEGYTFSYAPEYLQTEKPEPVSVTLPLTDKAYTSKVMLPFFDGLIPEGWLLEIAEKNWKLKERDRMGLLLACCHDCIGAVSIRVENKSE